MKRRDEIKNNIRWLKAICVMFMMLMPLVTKVLPVDAASSVRVRYFNKTVNFTRQQLGASLDGKSVSLGGTPGLSMRNAKKQSVYMVPANDVFEKGLGASYSCSNGNITIKKWNVTIKMKLNSKTAYVNGKKKTLAHPPVMVRYIKANKTKVLVPARFVAATLGYTYTSVNKSASKAVIQMTTPFYVKYDGTWRKYTRTQAKLTFDGTQVSVSAMPCIVMNEMFYVQARAFKNSVIGAKYSYNASTKTIVLKYGENTIQMALDDSTAVVNGESVNMPATPELTVNGKNNKEYVMVPIAFVAKYLGFLYSSSNNTKTCILSRPDSVYFDWKVTTESDENKNTTEENPAQDGTSGGDTTENTQGYSKITSVAGERSDTHDIITIKGDFTEDAATVAISGETITITFANTENPTGRHSMEPEYPYLFTNIDVSDGTSKTTIVTITRKSTAIDYEVKEEDGLVVVTLSPEQAAVKNSIRIAVDCGHGAYTAGKRTPKLPASLDFNDDGIFDARKGTQIREHTANTGVGKYVVKALERCGFTVYKSGFGTTDTPLLTRQANIKAFQCDYSISIHFNATGNGTSFNSAQGIEAFAYKDSSKAGKSKSLAAAVLNQVIHGTWQVNRGVNTQHRFAMCNTKALGTKASILLECAFMTNWNEVKNMMANESYWQETGEETAKGFCNYLGVPYVEES